MSDVNESSAPPPTLGVCKNEAVQRRAAGFLLDICPLAASQHHCSGHQGLLSCSRGEVILCDYFPVTC